MQQWLLLLLLAGAAALASFFLNYGRQRQKKLPPGPRGWPVIGNLDIFRSRSGRLLHQELDRLSKQYGPIMSLRLGSRNAIVVSSPAIAKQILMEHDLEFASRPKVSATNTLSYGDNSLPFSSYSPRFRFMRKTVTQELLSVKRVQQFVAVRADETSRMLRSILRASESEPASALDMNRRTTYLLMNMMTRILFNRRFYDDSAANPEHNSKSSQGEEKALEFKRLIEDVFFLASVSIIGDFVPALGFLDRINNYKAAMVQTHDRYDVFLGGILEEHRRQHQLSDGQNVEKDIVDIMLSLQGKGDAEMLEDDMIKGLVMNMINAGTDTSSSTIEWGLAELLRNPKIMHKVQKELDSVVGTERVVVEADTPKLPYLQAVVKEVLRLHTPGPLLLPHENTQPCQIAGFDIPAGTATFVNVWRVVGETTRVFARQVH